MKNNSNHNSHRLFRALPLVTVLLLAGCGIPNSMHVRSGGEPAYEDDDVMFRTIYYFRVVDYCETGKKPGNQQLIQNDSLYRFKMTGKAKSSVNHVRFESGTLQAWQIDPFGASVEFDKETGKPYFVSQEKREESLKQNAYYTEVRRLRGLKGELNCATSGEADVKLQCAIIDTKIKENLQLIGPAGSPNLAYSISKIAAETLEALGARLKPQPPDPAAVADVATATAAANKTATDNIQKDFADKVNGIRTAEDILSITVALDSALKYLEETNKDDSKLKTFTVDPSGKKNDDAKDKAVISSAITTLQQLRQRLPLPGTEVTPIAATGSNEIICSNNVPARRGFQILGPEGWRTFNQDERLVLAMSGSGKPLLDALRDLSSRAMAQKTDGLSKEKALTGQLALAQARAKLTEVKQDKPDDLAAALDEVVKAFNK